MHHNLFEATNYTILFFCSRNHGMQINIFMLVWRCHHIVTRYLTNSFLRQVSRQSPLSANDKDNNETIPGTLNKSPGIYLTAEKNSGKPQLGDSIMKAERPVITSNGFPCLQMTRTSQHIREGESEKVNDGTLPAATK